MEPFLDRRAFPGPAIDLAASGASFAGQACFNGCIAVTNWQRADVERLLPPELALAANASATTTMPGPPRMAAPAGSGMRSAHALSHVCQGAVASSHPNQRVAKSRLTTTGFASK